MSELAAEYAEFLGDLTSNNKGLINSLTMVAGENAADAGAVAGALEAHLSRCAAEHRLPALYLLDSIAKNVGGAYLPLFSSSLPTIFANCWNSVGQPVRSSMERLLKTWWAVFPAAALQPIDTFVAQHRAAAAAGFSTQPQLQPQAFGATPRLQQPLLGGGMALQQMPAMGGGVIGAPMPHIQQQQMPLQMPQQVYGQQPAMGAGNLGVLAQQLAMHSQGLQAQGLPPPPPPMVQQQQQQQQQQPKAHQAPPPPPPRRTAAGEGAAVVDFGTPAFRLRNERVVRALYTDLPHQCAMDGRRFRTAKALEAHHDALFAKRKRAKERGSVSRQWYVNSSTWLSGVRKTDTETPSFFQKQKEAEDAEVDFDALLTPADEAQPSCALCGERFEEVWSEEREEWMYRGAVRDGKRLVHAKCRSRPEAATASAAAGADVTAELAQAAAAAAEAPTATTPAAAATTGTSAREGAAGAASTTDSAETAAEEKPDIAAEPPASAAQSAEPPASGTSPSRQEQNAQPPESTEPAAGNEGPTAVPAAAERQTAEPEEGSEPQELPPAADAAAPAQAADVSGEGSSKPKRAAEETAEQPTSPVRRPKRKRF